MVRTDEMYQKYVSVLEEELLPAMGCTEPIAIAYAAAKAREVLGAVPERMFLAASGNIIKNVKSVVVPNTGHMRGFMLLLRQELLPERRTSSSKSLLPLRLKRLKRLRNT